MGDPDSEAVERTVHIRASPESVFQYFVDPQKMLEWKGTEADLDPKPGGIYRVNVTGRDIACGEYLEIVPHSKVVFTWGWEGGGHPVPPGSSTVEITLQQDGDGTLVRLRHYNLPDEDARGQHTHGWEHYLSRLQAAADGTGAGIDPWTSPEAHPQQQTEGAPNA